MTTWPLCALLNALSAAMTAENTRQRIIGKLNDPANPPLISAVKQKRTEETKKNIADFGFKVLAFAILKARNDRSAMRAAKRGAALVRKKIKETVG